MVTNTPINLQMFELNTRSEWSAEEDARLIELKEIGRSWREIASQFRNHNPNDCLMRYSSFKKKAPAKWTRAELEKLEELVATDQTNEEMVEHFPGRSVQACRMARKRLLEKEVDLPAGRSTMELNTETANINLPVREDGGSARVMAQTSGQNLSVEENFCYGLGSLSEESSKRLLFT